MSCVTFRDLPAIDLRLSAFHLNALRRCDSETDSCTSVDSPKSTCSVQATFISENISPAGEIVLLIRPGLYEISCTFKIFNISRSIRNQGKMKYFTIQVTMFALLLTPAFSLDDSPWLSLNISSKELCSMLYGNFHVSVYEHIDNQNSTTIQGHKKYFYTPIALLNRQSIFSTFNNLTNHPEVRFRIEMRNEKLESEVVHYLKNFVKKQVKANQVQVIPLDKVILASSTSSTAYYLSRDWLPYRKHKSLWFSLFCFQQKVFLVLWEEKPYNNIEIRNNDYQTSSMGTSQL